MEQTVLVPIPRGRSHSHFPRHRHFAIAVCWICWHCVATLTRSESVLCCLLCRTCHGPIVRRQNCVRVCASSRVKIFFLDTQKRKKKQTKKHYYKPSYRIRAYASSFDLSMSPAPRCEYLPLFAENRWVEKTREKKNETPGTRDYALHCNTRKHSSGSRASRVTQRQPPSTAPANWACIGAFRGLVDHISNPSKRLSKNHTMKSSALCWLLLAAILVHRGKSMNTKNPRWRLWCEVEAEKLYLCLAGERWRTCALQSCASLQSETETARDAVRNEGHEMLAAMCVLFTNRITCGGSRHCRPCRTAVWGSPLISCNNTRAYCSPNTRLPPTGFMWERYSCWVWMSSTMTDWMTCAPCAGQFNVSTQLHRHVCD